MISCPLPIEVRSTPAISGSSCSPLEVGDAPLTICWYCGRYVTAPNSEKPTTSPIRLQTVNTRLRNSDSGITGSAARRSTSANSARVTTAPIPSPTTTGEPQAYWVPPHVVRRTMHTTPADSSAVPR